MAKFIVLLSIFALLSLVAVNASIHRTVVTTEIDEEENPSQQTHRCRQQIQRQDLSHCEQFITQSRGYNPEHRQQCCQQLRQMDEECRCEALQEIVRQQRQQGQMHGEEMREMMQRAKSIPSICGMERCQFSQSETEDDIVNPRQDCRRQIQRQDLSHCEQFITQSRGYNPEHRQQCCQQLRQMDEECRCEALQEIVRQQRQQGHMQGEEMREMMQRAKSIPSICGMERCRFSQRETEDEIVNPRQDCRRQVQKQDFSKCERFITSRRGRLAMFTSNPEESVQGCCQQLRHVDEQCRCEALKQIVREQQQEGEFEGQEMQEMMQKAKNIPKMCDMEPRSCQWRLVLV